MVPDEEKKSWPCAKCGLQRSNFTPHVHGVQDEAAALHAAGLAVQIPKIKVGGTDGKTEKI